MKDNLPDIIYMDKPLTTHTKRNHPSELVYYHAYPDANSHDLSVSVQYRKVGTQKEEDVWVIPRGFYTKPINTDLSHKLTYVWDEIRSLHKKVAELEKG